MSSLGYGEIKCVWSLPRVLSPYALLLYVVPVRADLAVGQRFADLTFSGTLSAADRAYLGLTRPGPFTLKDIQARYVLLEIFSDSCPHCMLAAPGVNRLFRLIEQNPRLRGGGRAAGVKDAGGGFLRQTGADGGLADQT